MGLNRSKNINKYGGCSIQDWKNNKKYGAVANEPITSCGAIASTFVMAFDLKEGLYSVRLTLNS
jgi:hypothetical protein